MLNDCITIDQASGHVSQINSKDQLVCDVPFPDQPKMS